MVFFSVLKAHCVHILAHHIASGWKCNQIFNHLTGERFSERVPRGYFTCGRLGGVTIIKLHSCMRNLLQVLKHQLSPLMRVLVLLLQLLILLDDDDDDDDCSRSPSWHRWHLWILDLASLWPNIMAF